MLTVRVPYREDLAPYLLESCPYQYVHLRNFDEYSLRLLFERIFNRQVLQISLAARGAWERQMEQQWIETLPLMEYC